MPIPVQCECGKRTTVGDPLAGKTIRCPSCGSDLYVPKGAPTTASVVNARKTAAAGSAFQITGGASILLAVGGVVGVLLLIIFLGPVRVRHEWNAMGDKPETTVQNVVEFALSAWSSQHGGFNPRSNRGRPSVDSLGLDSPYVAFSMPDKVSFAGRTNQGKFFGFYHPKTGEVEARIEHGGYSFAGMVDIAKAAGEIKVKGRMGPDNQPQAEDVTNGTPQKLTIYYPPPSDE
jgi:hypothetical protein